MVDDFLGWLELEKNQLPKQVIAYLLSVIVVTVGLMMPVNRPLWLASGLGHYIQYPWRLLIIINLATLLLFLHLSSIKVLIKKSLLSGLIALSIILSTLVFARPRGCQDWSDHELFEYFKTTTIFNEFQPIWAAEYTRHFPQDKLSFRQPDHPLYGDEISQSVEGVELELES